MMLDRTLPPVIKPLDSIHISSPLNEVELPGGLPLFYLNQGDQDLVRMDWMVSAGKWQQAKNLVSFFTNRMLKEGTSSMNGKEIAEQLDYYGAWLQLADGFHYSYLTVYSLNKYFKQIFDLLLQMFSRPAFPESAFDTLRNRYRQQMMIDNEQVGYLADKGFVGKLFGLSHPYGKTADEKDLDAISTADLSDFHNKHYRFDNLKLILSGKVTDDMIVYCGERMPVVKASSETGMERAGIVDNADAQRGRFFVEKKGALQNALRLGLPVINRSHPDFPGLHVLNTILGGYFGSRLMSNIREEKGYTYGISSGVVSLRHAAYLSVATETAGMHTEALIDEVYREIDRLQTDLVPPQELDMVRNYIMGDFARSLDGAFSLADVYISLLATDMKPDFIYKQAEVVRGITSDEIKQLAQRYLIKDQFVEFVAGVR